MSDILKRFNRKVEEGMAEVRQARNEDDKREIMQSIGQELAAMLAPFLTEVASSARANKELLREMMYELRGEVASRDFANIDTAPIIKAIELAFGGIKTPETKISIVDLASRIKMPDEMNVRGFVQLMGVDMNNPLPVQLRDHKGNPVNLFEKLTSIVASSGGGAGKHDYFTIRDIRGSTASLIDQVEGALKVTGSFSVSAAGASSVSLVNADGTYYNSDNPLPITGSITTSPAPQVSGYADSVNVMQYGGSDVTTGLNETTNGTFRMVQMTDSVSSVYVRNPVDNGDSATALRVVMAGNSSSSVNVVNPVNQGDAATALRVVIAGNSDASVFVNNPVNQGDVATALRVVLAGNADASVYVRNPVDNGDSATALRVVVAGNSAASVTATQTGTWNVTVNGATASMVVVGDQASDVADVGEAPVKIGGIARQANPGAVAAGDRVSATYDDLGRQVNRPLQVRDLIQTAYVQVTTGTETTLRAAVAGAYLDLIYIMGSNASDAAVSVDIRPVTAGNVVMTLQIPASGTAGIACPVPLPQSDTGNNWTADMPDITGTTVSLTALFSQEV